MIGVVLAGAASIFSGCTTDPNYWNSPRAAQDMNLLSFITGIGVSNASSPQQARSLAISSELMARESTRLSIENSRSNSGNNSVGQRGSPNYSGESKDYEVINDGEVHVEILSANGVIGDLNKNGFLDYNSGELDSSTTDELLLFAPNGVPKPYAYIANVANVSSLAKGATLRLYLQDKEGGSLELFRSWHIDSDRFSTFVKGTLGRPSSWITRWTLQYDGFEREHDIGSNRMKVINGGFAPKR